MKTNFLFVCYFALLSGITMVYGSLEQARVSRILNEVFIHENAAAEGEYRPAQAGVDVISGEQILRTGQRSRAELIFADDSLARIGSNTLFTFQPQQREMFLGRGLLLYQASKGSGNTTRISTATATASITGTTVLIEVGQRVSKIILLEGSMRVEIPGRPGEYVDLKAGQMLLFPNDATRLPDPVDIDIVHLVQTSDLIQGFDPQETEAEGLGRKLDYAELQKAWDLQKEYLEQKKLETTDLVIPGRGSVLVLNLHKEPFLHLADTDPMSQGEGQDAILIVRDTRLPDTEDDDSDDQDAGPPKPPAPLPPAPIVLARPPLIGKPDPFILDERAEIQTNPHIIVGEDVYPGAIYYPTLGPLPQFLYGSVNQVDQLLGFDGVYDGPPTAWFRFANLQITADPMAINVLDGVSDVGLIAEDLLTVVSGHYTFAPLHGLLLTARNQVILQEGVSFDNPQLSLAIYNRSASNELVFSAGSSFVLQEMQVFSGSDVYFAGVHVDIADELGIYSLGEVSLGTEQWLWSNNIEVAAQTLNLMSYSGFGVTGCGAEDTSLFLSTVGDMNLEPYEGQGLQYLYFEHQDVVLDIGGNLNGEDWFLAYMSQLTVGGDMALYSLDSTEKVHVGGDITIGSDYHAQQTTLDGSFVAETANVGSLNAGGNVTAGTIYLRRDLTVGGDLYLSVLESGMSAEEPEHFGFLLNGHPPLEVSTVSVQGDITINGYGETDGINWQNSTHALVLEAPRVIFADDAGIHGAVVDRLEFNGEGYDSVGGNFSVYGEVYIEVKNAGITVTGDYDGGTLLLESTDGYVHLQEDSILEAADQESYSSGKVTVRAAAPAPNGIAIQVSSSAQILALAQDSSILLEALAGDVEVAGTLNADRIEIVTHGDNGKILLLPEMNIMAEIFKAGAFGDHGELRIGGSETAFLSTSRQLYLYANATNGTVRFVGDANLFSHDLVIAAHQVKVDDGVQVYIESPQLAPARIYANEHHYNATGYGHINGNYTQDAAVNAPDFYTPPPPRLP